MNWLLYSLLMFIFSVCLYLLIRKAQLEKIHVAVYSISMFLIPSIANFVGAVINKLPLIYSSKLFGLVVLSAFIWSWLGNFFSQRAIKLAPNPGYSLILSKSYVILTAVLSVFLFDSELTVRKMLAILIIIGFSAVISISKDKGSKDFGKKWIWLSFGAHLCWGYGSLISKYFLNQGLSPFQYLPWIGLIVATLNIWEAKRDKVRFSFKKSEWRLIGLIGILGWMFNLSLQFAYKGAPNPGYVAAINASSIMAVTLLSAVFFKDNLSPKKVLGVLGVIVGLMLIVI